MTEQTNKQPPTVRLATRADQAQLMDLCRALHAENGLFKMDDAAVTTMLNRAFERQGGIIGVIDGETEIAACIYMLLSKFWYSTDDHLEELFAYVRPQWRKPAGYAAPLIAFAKKCSQEIGIPLVIGVLSNKQMEAKVRLYRKELGVPAGAFFVFNSPAWTTEQAMAFDPWRTHSRGRDWKRNKDQVDMPPATTTTAPLPVMALS